MPLANLGRAAEIGDLDDMDIDMLDSDFIDRGSPVIPKDPHRPSQQAKDDGVHLPVPFEGDYYGNDYKDKDFATDHDSVVVSDPEDNNDDDVIGELEFEFFEEEEQEQEEQEGQGQEAQGAPANGNWPLGILPKRFDHFFVDNWIEEEDEFKFDVDGKLVFLPKMTSRSYPILTLTKLLKEKILMYLLPGILCQRGQVQHKVSIMSFWNPFGSPLIQARQANLWSQEPS